MTGLKVSKNNHGERGTWSNIPEAYTRENLLTDVEEVATQEKARKWVGTFEGHNRLIVSRNLYGVEIGLLIGVNCLKTLEPEEVLPSKDGGSFAFRTPLGSCTVGLLHGLNYRFTLCKLRSEFFLLQLQSCKSYEKFEAVFSPRKI